MLDINTHTHTHTDCAWFIPRDCCCTVAQSCLTLCNCMNCSTPTSLSNSQSLLQLMSSELVMPSNHLILCCPLLPPSIFPSTRVFSNESVLHIRWPKNWSFSFSISPFNEYKLLRWSCFSLSAPLGKMSISETCQKYIHMTLLWSRSPTAQLKVWHVTVGP